MAGEIELISDGQGLLLRGDSGDIERFLASENLPAAVPVVPRLEKVLAPLGVLAEAAGQVSANSGRWLKITKESAEQIKKFGLVPAANSHTKYAMIGKAGASKAWIQVVQGPGTMLTNPAVLSGVGAVMTQMAMQQAMNEITGYLADIDEKVDDVLRAQKDAALAEVIGVGIVIDEAMTIREYTGHVSEVVWSKVQGSPQTLAAVQAYALRQLDALVEKVEAKAKTRDVADEVAVAEPKVREWLAVIARSFQLQEAVAVLELDRVLDAGTDDLDQHREGLKAARRRRLDAIARSTDALLDRLGLALGLSNSKVLFHPGPAAVIARSGTAATRSVVRVQELLAIESGHKPFESTNWTGAARQLARSARDTGAEGLDSVRHRGDQAIGAAFKGGDRLADAYARRSAERRAKSGGQPTDESDQAPAD